MAEQVSLEDEVPVRPVDNEKITILPGHAPNYSAATFCLKEEDHTLGNALRWMVMKNPDVEFCGYSAPHPSEPKIHLRIQMYDDLSAISCLFSALARLRELFATIEDAYKASLADESGYVKEADFDVKAEVEKVKREGEERRRRVAEERGVRNGGDVEMA